MNQQIERIRAAIQPLRQQIINHKVYSVIRSIDDLKIFMQYHVYAVWDFMSLLKTLQNQLTCTSVPWFPMQSANSRYLINEIVLGEESDVDMNGIRKSHFELYLEAMRQCEADTAPIELFIAELKQSGDFARAFQVAAAPHETEEFVNVTFKVIKTPKTHVQSAVFTFGREDLIPGMFLSIIADLNKHVPDTISILKYYLERHIEVDGDHHSHLALEMTTNLCGDDDQKWKEAEEAIIEALQSRINLWDGVYNTILRNK